MQKEKDAKAKAAWRIAQGNSGKKDKTVMNILQFFSQMKLIPKRFLIIVRTRIYYFINYIYN